MLFSTSGAGWPQAFRQAPPEGVQAAWHERSTEPAIQTQPAGVLRDFGILSSTEGWILVGQHLYWTTSNAASWSDITPALPAPATVYSVGFLDTQLGWLLWSSSEADGSLVLQIERTSDAGRSWTNSVIQTMAADDPLANVENASMDWLDPNSGWISVRQKTGSNFSSGISFNTQDGGQTWQRMTLPIGEPVHFVNNQVGWMAGGPAGDQLFKTQDGGKTWEKQPLPAGLASGQNHSLYPPVFDSTGNGLLTVVSLNGNDFQLEFYSTGEAGQSWMPVSSFPLGSQTGWLPLSLLDARNLVAAVPNSDQIIHMVNGEGKIVINQDGRSAAIVDLKMLSSNFGWAKWNKASCTPQAATDANTDISCSSTTGLIETQDGGITWETLGLPGNVAGGLMQSYQSSTSGLAQSESVNVGKTLLAVGQGFDICSIPTLSQLQTWWNTSPYRSVNLYIGGVARACPNPALTAAYVNQMRQQGWHFIPTWVGPQAPCTNFIKRFSYDVNTAFIQGKDEAFFATTQLAALGLTFDDLSGSIAYYDMEIYGNDTACREAVNAFVNGWVTHMHDLGNLAGVYGATGVYYYPTGCTSGLGDYLTIPNIPDAIWPARWYLPAGQGTYDPNASVWNIGSCIPGTAWNNHQRIRQYAGDHSETWGGVTLLGIDDDVLDGVVAVPYFGNPSANFSASVLSGDAPLTVPFTILNTAFMTSCTWDYGDGQTGSSCAYSNTHTYSNPGTYTVSLTVSSPWGTSDSMTRSDYITVNTVNPGGLDHFTISHIATQQTAGTAITGITLTAQDVNNKTLTSFTGTVTYSGTAGITGTSPAFSAGQLTGVSVTPRVAGNDMTFIVTCAGKSGSSTFNVYPGTLDHFAISAIASPQTAGTAITGLTLTAQDLYANTVTSFNGAVTYGGTAGVAGLSPAFSAGQLTGVSVMPSVAGTGMTFIVTGSGKSGTSAFDVNPGALEAFSISSIASPQTAGTAITGLTLTAQDHFNNKVTSFTGSVTYSGTAGITGTSGAFSAGQLTGVSVTPTVAGVGMTFIVTGSGKTGSSAFNVNPGALDHFAISGIGSPQTTGTAITGITLTAQDLNNNTVTSFYGTVVYSGTAGITGISPAFTAGQLTGVSVMPMVAGTSRTFIVTGSGKSGTSTFDVNPNQIYLPLVIR